MQHFTLENTNGYSEKELDILNEGFELFLSTEEFDLDNYNDLQNAKNKFFNNVMIYG
jgi:hypothetical protein